MNAEDDTSKKQCLKSGSLSEKTKMKNMASAVSTTQGHGLADFVCVQDTGETRHNTSSVCAKSKLSDMPLGNPVASLKEEEVSDSGHLLVRGVGAVTVETGCRMEAASLPPSGADREKNGFAVCEAEKKQMVKTSVSLDQEGQLQVKEEEEEEGKRKGEGGGIEKGMTTRSQRKRKTPKSK